MTSKGIEFKTTELSLSIQKKLFGRMAKKNVVKHLIDDNSAQLLDHLHQLNKIYINDLHKNTAKDSDKIVKNIIKIVIKIAVLILNEQFTDTELQKANEFQRLLRTALMTIVSFHEVEFSYDRNYLTDLLEACRKQLKQLINTHLSDKSLNRVDNIFDYFTNTNFLDRFFTTNDPKDAFFRIKQTIIDDINLLLDRKRF